MPVLTPIPIGSPGPSEVAIAAGERLVSDAERGRRRSQLDDQSSEPARTGRGRGEGIELPATHAAQRICRS